MKKIYKKYFSVFILLVSIVVSFPLSIVFGLEVSIMVILGSMSVAGILGVFEGGFRNVPKISRMVYIFSIFLVTLSYFHIKNIDVEMRELNLKEYTITEVSDYYLLEIDGYRLLRLEIDDISYDNTHPLNFYKFYKTDIFGYEIDSPGLKVKSELMHEYIKPIIIRN